jgi:hypothetical protein
MKTHCITAKYEIPKDSNMLKLSLMWHQPHGTSMAHLSVNSKSTNVPGTIMRLLSHCDQLFSSSPALTFQRSPGVKRCFSVVPSSVEYLLCARHWAGLWQHTTKKVGFLFLQSNHANILRTLSDTSLYAQRSI